MGYKLKRILIRPNGVEKQVYPGIITQTYTIPAGYRDASGTATYIDMYKSGYKIKEITIEGGATSNEAYSGVYVGLSQNSNRDYELRLAIDFGSSNTLGGYIRYRTGGTNYNDYSIPTSAISRTSNTYKVKFTRTGWTLALNGNSYSGTDSSGMANVVGIIMDSQTCKIQLSGIRTTISEHTYTVTYEKA